MLENDLILVMKLVIAGFFCAFISIPGISFVSHNMQKKHMIRGIFAAIGTLTIQCLWGFIAIIVTYFVSIIQYSIHPVTILTACSLLFFIATVLYKRHVRPNQSSIKAKSWHQAFVTGLLIEIQKPMRILIFVSVLLILHIIPSTKESIIISSMAIVSGISIFWAAVCYIIYQGHFYITPKIKHQLFRYAAFVLIIFSLIGLIEQFF